MIEINESQTAAFLKSKVMDTFADYGLSLKNIFSVTCDNGANMVATVRKLNNDSYVMPTEQQADGTNIDELDESDVIEDDQQCERNVTPELANELSERITLVRCAVHTLQLAILDVVDKSDESIRAITAVARKCKLVKYRSEFESYDASYPPVWSRTRWGGIFKMMEPFVHQKRFFNQLADNFPELDLSNQWSYIEHYYDTFKPLYICTKQMQEKHVSLSDFYMAWLMATSEVQKVRENSFSPHLLRSLNNRLNVLRQLKVVQMALYLDPRFNYRGSKIFTAEEKDKIQQYIVDTWERICQLGKTPASTSRESSTDDFDQSLTQMFGESVNLGCETGFLQQVKSLDLEPCQKHNYNVWDHWLRRKITHPEIYTVAMVVLSTPSNQVSVERSFSALALVLSNQRTGLGKDTLENINWMGPIDPITHHKTEVLVVSNRKAVKMLEITIGEERISSQRALKHLGVIADDHLSFNAHVDYACEKAANAVNTVARFMPNVDGRRSSVRRY
ncbi:uncharacterized protein LOC131428945 [Malaya genurostris]|uniref:uncharacterized protein LOC131428945 n=1 Tax=Malaya genurostris TaxID=325434 RepID=UPI0026F3FCF7|nr:uncharacterized protein LOC131428945 [Malaya genurostris]